MESQPSKIDPWLDAAKRYQPEQAVQGVITRVTHFGIFAQIEPDLEGIIYSFELGAARSALAGYAPGQTMQLYVKSIDEQKRRLELSPHRQSMPGPLEENALPAEVRQKKAPDTFFPLTEFPLPGPLPDGISSSSKQDRCPVCQREIQTFWKYCVYCGQSLLQECSSCGNRQPRLPGAGYCAECGNPLD